MTVGKMIVHDKVVGRQVVNVETDGKHYTSLLLDSGVRIEPHLEEKADGTHEAYLKVVIKHEPTQKAGPTAGSSEQDSGAAEGGQEDD